MRVHASRRPICPSPADLRRARPRRREDTGELVFRGSQRGSFRALFGGANAAYQTAMLIGLQRVAGNAAVQRAIEGGGEALDERTRRSLEGRVGDDLSETRIHTDSDADHTARALGATAFTLGRHMFFRSGEYDPNTESGQRLIAHEAAHVAQQWSGAGPSFATSPRHEDAAATFAAGGALTAVAAPAPAVQRQSDDGSDDAAEMPFPMERLTVEGEPNEFDVEGGCDGLSLHGQANATYDGGRAAVAGQKVTTSTACGDCGDQPCLHMTGTLVTKYTVSVAITMPPMPDGLSKCEQGKVRAFLRDVLLPHEKDHEQRFKTYNGQTRNPIDITGCGQADLQSQVTAMVVAEDQQRQASANALSGAIDPFTQVVDCSDCDDGG